MIKWKVENWMNETKWQQLTESFCLNANPLHFFSLIKNSKYTKVWDVLFVLMHLQVHWAYNMFVLFLFCMQKYQSEKLMTKKIYICYIFPFLRAALRETFCFKMTDKMITNGAASKAADDAQSPTTSGSLTPNSFFFIDVKPRFCKRKLHSSLSLPRNKMAASLNLCGSDSPGWFASEWNPSWNGSVFAHR